MSSAGVVYKDLLPVPHITDPEDKAVDTSMTDKPTDSHALAIEAAHKPTEVGDQNSAEPKVGAAQQKHADEVMNLGWNEPKEAVENPLVGGLSNEDLWVLVRRFNKVSGLGKGKERG